MEDAPMGSIDLPDTSAVYDAAGAQEVLKSLEADWRGSPHHPYWDERHPQHQAYLDKVRELHVMAAEGDQYDSPLQQRMAEGLNEQEQRQADILSQAENIIDEMADFGYQRPGEVFPDLTSDELNLLQLHLRAVQGDWEETLPQIRDLLYSIKPGPVALDVLRDLERSVNDDDRLLLAQEILKHIWKRQRQIAGLPPR